VGEREPAHSRSGVPRPVCLPVPLPLGGRLPLVAAPTQGFGLLLGHGCLAPTCRSQPADGTPQRRATGGVALALAPPGQLLRLWRTRRYLPGHTGGTFCWVRQHSHITLTLPEQGLSSYQFLQGLEAMT